MRIAVVADDLYPGFGGQAAATEGHISALLKRGHMLRVVAGSEPVPAQPPAGVQVSRVPSWQPGSKQTRFAWPQRGALDDLLSWAEVLQCNTPTPLAVQALRAARRRGIPSAIGIHAQEESTTSHAGVMKPLATMALRRWYRFVYSLPDRLIAPTRFAARLASSYSKRPVHVVSNGIRVPDEAPAAVRSAARARFLHHGETILLCYVGRLAEEKKPGRLLELFGELCRLRSDLRLLIAGDGPLRGELESQARRLGAIAKIDLLGFVSEREKSELLWAGDLFLMPSPTELQSIATLEAMARRCAVVTVDDPTSAVAEMVTEAQAGLSYSAASPEDAARRVHDLLDDGAQLGSMQERARFYAEQHDISESGRLLEGIYESLLPSRRSEAHLTTMGVRP